MEFFQLIGCFSISFCLLALTLQFNFFRRTHQSGHREVLGGAPVVADTRIQTHGSLKFAQSVVLTLGGSMSQKRRS